MKNLSIIIIEKTAVVKTLCIKDYNPNELYKKCGFTKSEGFEKQTEWIQKIDKITYQFMVYAKKVGKANYENKYEFPPPIDKDLFYGSCAVICKKMNLDKKFEYVSITIPLWQKVYEILMGGFEDLSKSAKEDEEEEDELENIPDSKKTKTGYLKDGFIVDGDTESDLEIDESDDTEDTDDEEGEEDEEEDIPKQNKPKKINKKKTETYNNEDTNIDITTELQEEPFSDDEN
jgi:hypothetical protein